MQPIVAGKIMTESFFDGFRNIGFKKIILKNAKALLNIL
jgi:hypothetical protein